MYRQTTAADGTVSIQCLHCQTTRGFRSELMLRKWKRDHLYECPAHRGQDQDGDGGGAA